MESGHKPLEMISLKNLIAASSRLQRMLLRLQGYDLSIIYCPGKETTLADRFSWLPNKKTKEEINFNVRVNFVQFSAEKLTQIHQATKADPILCELRETILQGWPNTFREISKNLQPYWSYRDQLAIENGILMKSGQIIIPKMMQPEILQKIHHAHQGMKKWKLRAKSCVFWNNINPDINKVVQGCVICQEQQKTQYAESLKTHKISVRPWQIVATDLFQFGRLHYMLVVDYYSKYPLVRKLKDFSSRDNQPHQADLQRTGNPGEIDQ